MEASISSTMMCLGTRSSAFRRGLLELLAAVLLRGSPRGRQSAPSRMHGLGLSAVKSAKSAISTMPLEKTPTPRPSAGRRQALVVTPMVSARSRGPRRGSAGSRRPQRGSHRCGVGHRGESFWPVMRRHQGELLVVLVAAHPGKVIAAGIEEQAVERGVTADSTVGGSPGRSLR